MNEIFIYDDIGPDWAGMVSAKSVIEQLKTFDKSSEIAVRINSPGGDVVEAQAIYNALRRHSGDGGKVTIEIDSLAASAASYVAMAGDTIRIAENAMIMVHRAWTIAFGNSEDLRSTAEILDKFDGIITSTYVARTGSTAADVAGWMAAETWMTAQEALSRGFADEIGDKLAVKASLKSGRYRNTPQQFVATQNRREVERSASVEVAKQQILLTRRRMGL